MADKVSWLVSVLFSVMCRRALGNGFVDSAICGVLRARGGNKLGEPFRLKY